RRHRAAGLRSQGQEAVRQQGRSRDRPVYLYAVSGTAEFRETGGGPRRQGHRHQAPGHQGQEIQGRDPLHLGPPPPLPEKPPPHWRTGPKAPRPTRKALLIGQPYDDRGNRMSPSFSTNAGVRYRFYVSSALLRGRKAEAGSVGGLAAQAIEDA